MALADLIARLEHDADARIAELTAKAEAEARSLLAEASRVKETLRTTELSRRRASQRAKLERELADARARARAQVLEARHAVLARIFAQARERLPALGASERWAAVLPHHLEQALRYVEGQRVIGLVLPQIRENERQIRPATVVHSGRTFQRVNRARVIARRQPCHAETRLGIYVVRLRLRGLR